VNHSSRIFIAAVTLLIAGFAFFFQLGHYSLWDDEADTAIHAKGILATGDTSTIVGHNFYAYRNGVTLKNLRDRVTPPLSSYLAAGAIALFGDSPAAVRFPFALFGLATVALMLWWLHKDDASRTMWLLACIGILCNVSLFLFSRNCRYYGPVLFTSTALAYLYLHWRGTAWQRLLWVLASLVLLASNYISFIAVYLCLVADAFVFGRGRLSFSKADFAWTLPPVAVLGGVIISIWNPLATEFASKRAPSPLGEKLTLLWWNLRDTNANEFYAAGILLVGAVIAWRMKDVWMRRAMLAFAVLLVGTTIFSPQSIQDTNAADIRYCLPLIPLGIFIGARTLAFLGANMPGQILMLGAAVFFTNVLNGGMFLSTGFHSGIVLFYQELFRKPEDPYAVASAWINSHLNEGESIYVMPYFMTGPLIYHAPKAVYAWQLDRPAEGQFKDLAPINFAYQEDPDYLVVFGPGNLPFMKKKISARKQEKSRYIQVEALTAYAQALYRPEIFQRNFGKEPGDDGAWGIIIYKRVPRLSNEVKDSLIVPK